MPHLHKIDFCTQFAENEEFFWTEILATAVHAMPF
jgi:hypothetical protein